MDISEDRSSGMCVLRPKQARLDASVASGLRDALIERISRGEQTIIIDMGEVTFIDSSALGALIAAAKRLGPTGTIAVAAMATPVAKLFTLTRMDRVFLVSNSVHDAVKALAR
ncbi:STAS domain-containing protein [Pararhizobium antarcticum]|uniref:STAS domain-containing protein n=1 Tax=Pararhizobium antarcticum TaxID=1798805 RepID=A0A657LNZ4_9HYPH|nr:STAS domain-containing protein [Pararhizobium antarcticum]OJF93671.1 hypothetical protein AX760_21590 [Pararhizobium antarcticum]